MSGISKRVSGSWVSGDYGIMKTATDTITTLPAVIYVDGNNATVGISGNMEQTGTPTPTTPIQPQETGDRTGNLFDKNATDTSKGYRSGYYLTSNGAVNIATSARPFSISEYIEIGNISKITLFPLYVSGSQSPSICFYNSSKAYISGGYYDNNETATFDIPNNATYFRFSIPMNNVDSIMLNLGSTPLPYEPYGVKIPISSANTTTPVYLGEVETTRRIGKLVLTGEESWGKNGTAISGATIFTRTINDGLTGYTPFCTHYAGSNSTAWASIPTNSVTVSVVSGGVQRLAINVGAAYSEIDDFKVYLAAQYAAGTPVIIWYVLATEETGVVNEPIRKIGDYADTVSGITIPTIAGADSFDVLTTLKPSEVTANYHGWHTGAVHERDSGQWD